MINNKTHGSDESFDQNELEDKGLTEKQKN